MQTVERVLLWGIAISLLIWLLSGRQVNGVTPAQGFASVVSNLGSVGGNLWRTLTGQGRG